MNSRFLTTVDGQAITVSPTGTLTQVTYLYKLEQAPPIQTAHRTWFLPDTAEVTVHEGETIEVGLSGRRCTKTGGMLGKTIQRASVCYQEHHAPWEHLPVWAEGLLTLHDSYVQEKLDVNVRFNGESLAEALARKDKS